MRGAGSLDRRVQFRRAALTTGALTTRETWADHGSPQWAAFDPVRDSEKWAAGQVQATAMARFTVRWSDLTSGVDAKDRLVFEGREWHILGVKEADGRRRFLEITAVTGSD